MLGIEQLLKFGETRGKTLAHRVGLFFIAGGEAGVARIEVAQTDLLSRLDPQLFHDAQRCYNAWVTPQSRFPLADRPRLWGTAVSHYQVEGDDPCDWSEWERMGRTRGGRAGGPWTRGRSMRATPSSRAMRDRMRFASPCRGVVSSRDAVTTIRRPSIATGASSII